MRARAARHCAGVISAASAWARSFCLPAPQCLDRAKHALGPLVEIARAFGKAWSLAIRPGVLELLDELVRIVLCFTPSRIGVYGCVAHPTILKNEPTVTAGAVDIWLDFDDEGRVLGHPHIMGINPPKI